MLRILIFAVAFALSGAVLADSQPPIPSALEEHQAPDHGPSEANNKSENNKSDSGAAPPLIKQSISNDSERIQQRHANDVDNKSPNGWWSIVPNVVIALFTIVLSVSTILLWKATVDIGHADKAWVSWVGAVAEYPLSGSMDPVMMIQWKNAGRTPALRCNMFSAGHVINLRDQVPVFDPPPDEGETQAPLVPDVLITSKKCVFEFDHFNAWMDHQCRIILYGIVRYNDIFSKKRRCTEVCLEVQFIRLEDGTKVIVNLTPVGKQNTAT